MVMPVGGASLFGPTSVRNRPIAPKSAITAATATGARSRLLLLMKLIMTVFRVPYGKLLAGSDKVSMGASRSPRSSRGEGRDEGLSQPARLAASPPHPDRPYPCDPTSPRRRGEVTKA